MKKKKIIILGIILLLLGGLLIYFSLSKENFSIETKAKANCEENPTLYYELEDKKIYTYCLDSIVINNKGVTLELKNYLAIDDSILNTVMNRLEKENKDNYVIYRDGGTKKITSSHLTIVQCHTIENNNDIYFGPESMDFQNNFCK